MKRVITQASRYTWTLSYIAVVVTILLVLALVKH